jgi:hypothetical protein
MSRIDIFNHVMPSAYLEALKQHSRDPGIVRRMTSLRMLWDIEARVEMLEQWPDLKQVLTLAVPSPELLGGPELSPELARLANDGMAEMCVSARRAGRLRRQRGWRRAVASSRAGVRRCGGPDGRRCGRARRRGSAAG